MPQGYLCFVLHAHLPFVRHPEHEDFLEERWFFEAMTETYIPLVDMLDRLAGEKISFPITLSLSPPLITMLTDGLLQERYVTHLENLIELADREAERTHDSPFQNTAIMYQQYYRRAREIFCRRYGGNLVSAFKKHAEGGGLEIITCAATHGYLPLLMLHPQAVRAQVATAVKLHRQHLGQEPRGIWLPESAYAEGIDDILKEYGLKFFFTDTHGVLYASTRPRFGVYAPIYCPSGVAVFGRDSESSKQVWSSTEGYPGDYDYREFYRDIGFDLDYEYIKKYIHPEGIRIHTGIKYYRITGQTIHKEPYDFQRAMEKTEAHAANFMFNRQLQAQHLSELMDRPPVIVAPYDAELFGHWWFEGPNFLEHVIRKMSKENQKVELITPSTYLERHPVNQVATPCPSSWGKNGYNEVWLSRENDWIYPHLHMAAVKMTELADNFPGRDGLTGRALKQAARELLLAQSSDWAFIISSGTMVDYAVRRTKQHLDNFLRLYREIKENNIDEGWVYWLESSNNIFPDMDYTIYSQEHHGAAAAN